MDTINIAQSFTDEVTNAVQPVLLSEVTTVDMPIPAALGALAQYTPLSWDDTANAYILWAAGAKVAAITAYAVPDSASVQRAAVYTHGVFNIDAINWPAATTEAQVHDAMSGGALQFRKLLYSDKRIDGASIEVGPDNHAPDVG